MGGGDGLSAIMEMIAQYKTRSARTSWSPISTTILNLNHLNVANIPPLNLKKKGISVLSNGKYLNGRNDLYSTVLNSETENAERRALYAKGSPCFLDS